MQPDTVEVKIGGVSQTTWSSYSIEADLLKPADAWTASIEQRSIEVPSGVAPGAIAKVMIGQEVVLSTMVDEVSHGIGKEHQRLELTGRDGAGILLDCSAAIFAGQQMTLDQIVAKIVRPLGVKRIRIDTEMEITRDKISVEPGDSAWETLRRAAEANGLWPWFEPDGTLVVGGPSYDTEPVGTLVIRKNGKGNNVYHLEEKRSIHQRYSHVTVLGQKGGTGYTAGHPWVKATVRDDSVGVYRPKVVVNHEAVNVTIARALARKIISDGRVASYEQIVQVPGHRADSGVLWRPGQRVKVVSEPHGIDAVYFLMGRRLMGNKSEGQTTHLRLVEDGAWVLDALPHHRRRRRGKNIGPLRIVDVQ